MNSIDSRYIRNMVIDGIGEEGQAKLAASKVLVIGAGGLGSPVLYYLAAAGVGTLGVVDYDVVDITNLQRQILYTVSDIGRMKTVATSEKLSEFNPAIRIHTYNVQFATGDAEWIVKEYDFVVDCCDNYATKLLINDVCVSLQKPYSHGAVQALRGEVMTYVPGKACYRCMFEDLPEGDVSPASWREGILGSVAGIVGSIQATEAVKYLVGMREHLIVNRMLVVMAKEMKFLSLQVGKRKECVCSHPSDEKILSF